MSKLYLLLITQNRERDISEMIQNIYPTFDGIIACVHKPFEDRTYEILEQNKGSGRILTREFFPYHHSHSMNELLFCRHMKEGDFGLILDSPERITDKFIKELPAIVAYLKNSNIDCVTWDGRPYLFRYKYNQEFVLSPHWCLKGLETSITWSNKDEYVINKRKEEPWKSWCLNPIKYWFCYHISNETQIMYQKYGQDTVQKHEKIRQEFRRRCNEELNISLDSLNDLIEFYKKGIYPEWFIETTENEFRLSELFQLKVLNMDFMSDGPNGMHPRFSWSFREYLKNKTINQKGMGYKGYILTLNEKFGIKE